MYYADIRGSLCKTAGYVINKHNSATPTDWTCDDSGKSAEKLLYKMSDLEDWKSYRKLADVHFPEVVNDCHLNSMEAKYTVATSVTV